MKIIWILIGDIWITLAVQAASASSEGEFDVSFFIPFNINQTIDFQGGASAILEDDPGIGFGIGYHVSANLVTRFDVSWNSISYSAMRVIDDGANTKDRFSGKLDAFNMSLGGDYYFGKGNLKPFLGANVGWSYLDSNVPTGNLDAVCGWDPWFGYICFTDVDTYTSNKFSYGLSAGVKFNVASDKWLRVAYTETWRDFDNSIGSPSIGTVRLEFGATF
jgi:opacity protein-like surface antigen